MWSLVNGKPIFGNTMALHRFEDTRGMLRSDNRTTRMARLRSDRMPATCLLFDGLVTYNQKCYIHNECVTVDEELYPFRGRCSHIQYMHGKPAKYGLKFWVLPDAQSCYVSYASMYTGKDQTADRGSRGLG